VGTSAGDLITIETQGQRTVSLGRMAAELGGHQTAPVQ
jgi:hypothetical protein